MPPVEADDNANPKHDETMSEAVEQLSQGPRESNLIESDIARFWRKVNKAGKMPDQSNEHYRGLDQCWEWLASHDSDGYGCFSAGRMSFRAHRVACALVNGLNRNEVVCHKCDNPGCVNPSHMIRGSAALNNKDASIKGRAAFGDRNGTRRHPETRPRGDGHPFRINPSLAPRGTGHGNAKLDDEKVREIRRIRDNGDHTLQEIAAMYGVSFSLISNIARRVSWKHVV